MIKITQIKISIDQVAAVAPAEALKHGILSEEERQMVLRETEKLLRVSQEQIREFTVLRRSVDARKKQNIIFSYTVTLCMAQEHRIVKRCRNKNVQLVGPGQHDLHKRCEKNLPDREYVEEVHAFVENKTVPKKVYRPVVVGTGPAGLFAALTLAESGARPIVLERGSKLEVRNKKVSAFWDGKPLDPECNVQFGEGGAGTFSDGKLNTLVKDPTGRGRRVLDTFVRFGAPEEIRYLQKPHIGTDKLGAVVKAIRNYMIDLGAEVWFDTRFCDLLLRKNQVTGIRYEQEGQTAEYETDTVILATGHSARDTFAMLHAQGIPMEAKSFAIGVRMEHPQEMIGRNQYGDWYDKLWAADYKLTYTTGAGRGVYSFCMCPGGQVVNASSEPGRLVVNGMSHYARAGRNANSAIVVTISPEDYGGENVLAGMEFQRHLEAAAYAQGQGNIPVQLLGDYLKNKPSTVLGDVEPDLCGAYALTNVREILPPYVGDAIAESIPAFDRRIAGFGRRDAVVSGIESRTSSPIRIIRDETLQSSVRGLYPCGEGAGYAGGITSAAMDGIRVAEQIMAQRA